MSSEASALESALEFLLLQDNWYLKNTCGISLPCDNGAASVLQLARERGWKPEPSTPAAKAGDGWIDVEAVSARVHEAWVRQKRAAGFESRKSESGEELMVPYWQLSEAAKELDRMTVRTVLDAMRPAPPSPETNGG